MFICVHPRPIVFSANVLSRPWTWEAATLLKIRDGKIHQAETLLEQAPYGMLSGWSSWEDGMSSRPR